MMSAAVVSGTIKVNSTEPFVWPAMHCHKVVPILPTEKFQQNFNKTLCPKMPADNDYIRKTNTCVMLLLVPGETKSNSGKFFDQTCTNSRNVLQSSR